MLLRDRRPRSHVLADALHRGAAAALVHRLGHVAPGPSVAATTTAQTAPGACHTVAAPGHHVRVGHAAEQPRVCV